MMRSHWFGVSIVGLALLCGAPAGAQSVTTTPGLSLADTIDRLTGSVGAPVAGQAIGLASALEIATAPVGTLAGAFATKLDSNTGTKARKATTFGPSFAERAITSGEGNVTLGVSFRAVTYSDLHDISLNPLQLGTLTTKALNTSQSATADLTISSKMMVISGLIGVTDNLDVGFALPLLEVKLAGTSTLVDGTGRFLVGAQASGTSSGLGDAVAFAKYKFMSFGTGQPDPGGVAVVVNLTMPTGDRDNLRGLGLTRTLVSFVASGGQARFRPHVNGGFEVWNKGIGAVSDYTTGATVNVRHQVQYAAGLEFEAAPKLTLLVDFLGRHMLGGGAVGYSSAATDVPGATVETLAPLSDAARKLMLVPGLKLNLKGKVLLSLNALTSLSDNGLHAHFTPVVGLELGL
jgi:hypothetical protein